MAVVRLDTGRPQLTWRVLYDGPVSIELRDKHAALLSHVRSVVLLEVRSLGKDIGRQDWLKAPSFIFPSRTIIAAEVQDSAPAVAKDVWEIEAKLRGSELRTSTWPVLGRGDSFKLLVLLAGSGTGVHVDGALAGGTIDRVGADGTTIRTDRRAVGVIASAALLVLTGLATIAFGLFAPNGDVPWLALIVLPWLALGGVLFFWRGGKSRSTPETSSRTFATGNALGLVQSAIDKLDRQDKPKELDQDGGVR
jgi:hypothetical protein